MKYTKAPISIVEQIEKMKDRGMLVLDEKKAANYLSNISYYTQLKNKIMPRLLKTILFVCVCLLFASSCKTNHYGAKKYKHKRHKKNCNCPKFSHQEPCLERTYILQTT